MRRPSLMQKGPVTVGCATLGREWYRIDLALRPTENGVVAHPFNRSIPRCGGLIREFR